MSERLTMIYAAAERYSGVLQLAVAMGDWSLASPRDRWTCYLLLSYKYYSCDESVVPDTLFDMLCLQLLADGLPEGAYHGQLYDESALMAGTGYHIGDRLDATLVSIANFVRV